MKRLWMIFSLLWGLLFLTGCLETETASLPSPYEGVNELAGLTSSISNSSAGEAGITIIYANQTNKELTYGEAFVIEEQIGGSWHQIPYLDEDGVAFIEIAYLLPAGEDREWRVSWSNIYGPLDSGDYRLVKEFIGVEDDASYHRVYPVATEFKVE